METQYTNARKYYLANRNESITSIASKFGMNRKQLSKKLKEEGLYSGRNYDEATIQQAIVMLNKKIGITDIAKTLNVDRVALSRELVKRGLYQQKYSYDTSKYETSQMLAMLVDYYENNLSKQEVLTKYSISETFMYNVIRHYNMGRKDTTKYIVNHVSFSVIDNEEKAYWLGFLMADGYVSQEHNHIELVLAAMDKSHLLNFKDFLQTDSPIKDKEVTLKGKIFKAVRIYVHSEQIVKDLVSFGCIQNKSLVLQFPVLPKNLIHHFIRGYFDGDGSISLTNNKQLQFSLLGTDMFLDECEKQMKLHKNKRKEQGQAKAIRYSGNVQCKKIFDYLYQDATIYLERKYNKFIAVYGQDSLKPIED